MPPLKTRVPVSPDTPRPRLASARTAFTLLAATLGSLLGSTTLGYAQGANVQVRAPTDGEPVGRPRKALNVLLIMPDQHSARTVGCYQNGYGGLTQSLTPNIDRLALQGVKFANAVNATPQSAPSRFTILTGLWPHSHGLRGNNVWEQQGVLTFARAARDAGYATATYGKHYLMWLDQPLPFSEDHGFTEVTDLVDYGFFCNDNGLVGYTANGNYWQMSGLPPELARTGYTFNSNEYHPAGYFADRVIEFIEARAADGQPFYCQYMPYGPHTPLLPTGSAGPIDWAHMYHPFQGLGLPPNMDKFAETLRLERQQEKFELMTDDQWRETLSYYYGLVTQIDWNIGRVLDRLAELGLADDTLVIYTSDHGEMAAEMSCFTKGTGSYDATNLIPLIMRLPGVLPAGKVVSEPVGHVDLFPTFVELTGIPIPDDYWNRVEGRGMYDLMVQDQAPGDWPDVGFSEYNVETPTRHRMVRSADAKYSFDELGDVEEFYDLVSDPYELDNRISDPDAQVQATIQELRTKLLSWWNNERGHAPKYKKSGKPEDPPVPAEDPQPADGEFGVACDVNPEWLPCTAADVQRVYFGTNPGNLPLFKELASMESLFNPGTLAPATTYYWSVEGENANGTAPGAPWSFTTRPAGRGGPGLATAPNPAHRAEGVDLAPLVQWNRGPGTVTQNLYIGPEGDLQLLVSGLPPTTTSFAPGPLQAGVEYFWRIDSVNAAGTTEGDVWSFTTDPSSLPERVVPLYPYHLDPRPRALSTVGLEWKPEPSAQSYDVYFGTDFPLPFQGNQTGTSFHPGLLMSGETYFWRVDSVNENGKRQGWTSLFRAR